jgi:hypothetical protein
MAFDRELVLANVFASDQYKPSVRFEEPRQVGNEPPASGSRARAGDRSLASDLGADLLAALPNPKVMDRRRCKGRA